ncbi:MAG: energy transducer TonB [Emcibacteraceae bacterium]|nr:energy transducer TonB [Emcibacteraceae bacterium]
MTIRFIIFTLLLASQAMADKAPKKAEFEQLYAKFNELYANSNDIDPVIIIAEKLYKLAPRVYGKKSEEYVIIIYNLATLYDEKGGDGDNKNEKKAADLYLKYFRIQNSKKVKKDQFYLDQYIPYMFAYYHSHPRYAKNSIATNMLDIAYSLDLPNLDLANLEYYAAAIISEYVKIDYAIPHYEKALLLYEKQFGQNHFKVGELNLILGKVDLGFQRTEMGITRLLKAANSFEQSEEDSESLKINTYSILAQHYVNINKIEEATRYAKLVQKLTPDNIINDDGITPLTRVPPNYPKLAMEKGISGFVTVVFTINKDGQTKDVRATEYSNEIFVNNAVKAASKYIYSPLEKDGQPAEIRDVKVRIDFQIAGKNGQFGKYYNRIPRKIMNQLILKQHMSTPFNGKPFN